MSYRLNPEIIDRARKKLGVPSDEKLARELNISAGTVSRVRQGKEPSFATAIKLLDAAGMSLKNVTFTDSSTAA